MNLLPTNPQGPTPKTLKVTPFRLIILVTIALALVSLLMVISLETIEERAELILAPATCEALTYLAVPVQKHVAGCSYRGPVEHRFSRVLLQDIKISSDAILAERRLP
ncbi:hypothetical protein [Denitratisoma oestradiolicum]|uniref:Uncharacterized protein n=1 Tax=Denitratisoma oestradiolicum TaxID=311182 RepID=A0A6S6XU10_9PROT|nr:hypothetical protein [Denitratisoma oestradiolicum]TWO79279.1 hypothetical protein CBW56_15950 [Denitratisoma oestradiolicum]CAB1368290.1 protein of unknown function [Denitratisoma oestradiolicum]